VDFYLIRHTRVQGMEGKCYGRSDVDPGPDFRNEALAVRRKLAAAEHAVVYSSPATRCLALARLLDVERITAAPELQEMDFGTWEGSAWDSIPRADLDRWADDYLNVPCPQGESLRDMMDRVLPFWHDLRTREKSPCFLVTHAGPIRVLLASLLKLPYKDMFSLPVDFGGVWKISVGADEAPAVSRLD
jgi:alpha-ribazole phosphatase